MTDDLALWIGVALGFGYLGLWFWAMIDAGNKRKWAWFVLILLLSPVLFVFFLPTVWEKSGKP